MAYVVTGACIGVKDRACTAECPTECFHEGADQLYIHPELCIDCGHCVSLCPVSAIYIEAEVPADQSAFIEKNALVFTDQHQAGCGCGHCDPQTNRATGALPVAQPR